MEAESLIDLIVSPMLLVHLLPEPLQNIFVDSDGNPCLARARRNCRPLLGLAEIVLILHLNILVAVAHTFLALVWWFSAPR
jgi:hypothetical protein